MYRVVMVSSKPAPLSALSSALEVGNRLTVEWADSREHALTLAAGKPPDLMIVDETPGGSADLELVRDIMHCNALINVAVISHLPEEEFHEAAEGLGVLMQLPPEAGAEEARAVLSRLNQMGYLTNP